MMVVPLVVIGLTIVEDEAVLDGAGIGVIDVVETVVTTVVEEP